jgi:hypothetical protein
MKIFNENFFTVKSSSEANTSNDVYVMVISNNKHNALDCFDRHYKYSDKHDRVRCIVDNSDEYDYSDILCDKNGLKHIDFSSWSLFNIFVNKDVCKEFNRSWIDVIENDYNKYKVKEYYNNFLDNIRNIAKHQIEKTVKVSEPTIDGKSIYFFKNYNDNSIYIKIINDSIKEKTGFMTNFYYRINEEELKQNIESELYVDYRTKMIEYCISNNKIVVGQENIDKLSNISDISWYWKPLYSYYLFETIIEESEVITESEINDNSWNDDVDVDSIVGSIVKLRKQMFDNKGNLKMPETLKYLYSNEDKKEVIKEESNVILSSEFETVDEITDDIKEKIEKSNYNDKISEFISNYEKLKADGEYSNFEPETIEHLESIINDMKKRVKKND